MTTRRKVGIYPGTFDPIHEGHIAFALAAQQTHNLESVFFLPEAEPRNKPHVSSIHHRLSMLNHLLQDYNGLSPLILDEPNFNVETTLPHLQQLLSNEDLVLLMGSDVALSLPYWPHVDTLLRTVDVTIGLRSDDNILKLNEVFKEINAKYSLSLNPSYITAEHASLRSTDIRSGKIAHSRTMITSYMMANNLY